METPSSSRGVTRSQALAASNTTPNNNIPMLKKIEDSEQGVSKSRPRTGRQQQQDRSALIDITNDSPIVGVAMGNLETPSSATMSKKRNSGWAKYSTPGSGEALLRGQVKTLLQKVEEEAELSKLSLDQRPFLHLVNSPMALLAPNPANTPHVSNLSGNSGGDQSSGSALARDMALAPSPVEQQFRISQMTAESFDGEKQEGSVESEKSMITKPLLLDFSEKSEGGSDLTDCSSVVTYQGKVAGDNEERDRLTTDDDEDSVWSIQVNASTRDEEEDADDADEGLVNVEVLEEVEDDGGLVDDICLGLSKISVNGGGERKMAKFCGKHTRFLYNVDGETEGEEECCSENGSSSGASSPSSILHLKGLPTPKGKHLRFSEDLALEGH